MYGNRPDMIVGASLVGPVSVVKPDSGIVPAASTCGVGGCTGVLHKLVSSQGLNYVSGSVSVPCATSFLKTTEQEAGFIYVGGNSAGTPSNPAAGDEADAGLQVNAPSASGGTPASVQMFISADGVTGNSGAGFSGGPIANFHLACGQTASFEFWPAQAPSTSRVYLSLYVSALQQGTSTHVSETLLFETAAADHWSQVCPKCILKRVTSIAVKQDAIPQTVSGTYLGIGQPYKSCAIPPPNPDPPLSPQVQWSSVRHAAYAAYGPNATVSPSPWSEPVSLGSGYAYDDPSNGQQKGLIQVKISSSQSESDGINESGATVCAR